MSLVPTKPKGKNGGKRPGAGRPVGYRVTAATREKLRATIKTQLAIKTLHDLCEKGGQHDGVRATAALGLLRKVLPDLVATDITSGDKPLTVQMIDYTKLGDADK